MVKEKNNIIINIFLAALVIYTLYEMAYLSLGPMQYRAIHLALVLMPTFLMYPWRKGGDKNKVLQIMNWLFVLLAPITCAQACYEFELAFERWGAVTDFGFICWWILLGLVLEATRRTIGPILPILTIIFVIYVLFGHYIPTEILLSHAPIDPFYFASYQYVSLNGLFSFPLYAMSTMVAAFILFGGLFTKSGVGDFFTRLSQAVAGSSIGGPAKVSCVGSGFFGTISGSAVANVIATGSFTIPMMKKIGYPSHIAGAIEAVASTGGLLMPPIMGATAFILATYVGVPYLVVCLAAALPAILYYTSLFFTIHFEASKMRIWGLPKEQLPRLRIVLKDSHLIVPLIALVIGLAMGFTEMRAALYACVAIIFVSWVRKTTRMGPRKVVEGLLDGAKMLLTITPACACAGIIFGALTQSGLSFKFSFMLVELSGGILPVLLILAMISCLILGMGLTASAVYIIVAVLISPAIVKLGGEILAAHLFVLYYAILSNITPPVCMAAYAAATLAGSEPFKVGFHATRLGISGLIIPFLLIYRPAIMIYGFTDNPLQIIISFAVSLYVVFCLSIASAGYFKKALLWVERGLMIISALLMIYPDNLMNLISIVIFASIIVEQMMIKHPTKISRTKFFL